MSFARVCVCFGLAFLVAVQSARPHERPQERPLQHADDEMMMEFMGLDHAPAPEEFVAWALIQGGGGNASLPFAEEAIKKGELANVLLAWKLDRIEKVMDTDCPLGKINDFQRTAVSNCSSVDSPDCEKCLNHYEGSGAETANKDVDEDTKCAFVMRKGCQKLGLVKERAGRQNVSDGDEDPPDNWIPFFTEAECPRVDPEVRDAGPIGQVRGLMIDSAAVLGATQQVYHSQLESSVAHDNHSTHMVAVGAIKNMTMHLGKLMKSENDIVAKLEALKLTLLGKEDKCKAIVSAVDKAIMYVKTYGKVVWVKSGKDIIEHVVQNLQKMKEIQLSEEEKHKEEMKGKTLGFHERT